MPNRHLPRPVPLAGFTLVELTISLLVLTVVIVGVLALFDSTNHLAKNQLLRVDLQQSLRVGQREMVRTVRLAGRGGLQLSVNNSRLPDQGWALKVDNNVQSRAITTGAGAPDVVDNTDILTVRGVINTPVYLVEFLNPASFTLDMANDKGTVVIKNTTPESNYPQALDTLCDMLKDGSNRPEALLMVSAFDDRLSATAEVDYAGSDSTGCPAQVTVGFRWDTQLAQDSYVKLSNDGENPGIFPEKFLSTTRVGSVGILEEYRFYLRENPDGPYLSKLSRARVYPNTENAYDDDDTNLEVDIAENVIDFQVALAFDPDEDGLIAETADGVGDHWFGNSDQDKADEAPWTVLLADNAPSFRFARLTTLARTAEGDKNHMARALARLEDHVYSSSDPLNDSNDARRYPRIVFRSTVDLRNL